MTYTVETNEGTHPADPDWIERGTFETVKKAWAYIEDQSRDSEGRETTFGRNGRRVVDAFEREFAGPHDHSARHAKVKFEITWLTRGDVQGARVWVDGFQHDFGGFIPAYGVGTVHQHRQQYGIGDPNAPDANEPDWSNAAQAEIWGVIMGARDYCVTIDPAAFLPAMRAILAAKKANA